MHRIAKSSLFATIVGLVWACGSPTDACGCAVTRAAVVVIGTLRDASSAPMMNTYFVFESTSAAYAGNAFPSRSDARTDANGAFAVRAYSTYPSGVHSVVARIVRAGGNDTVRIAVGSAVFKSEREKLDTLRVALTLP